MFKPSPQEREELRRLTQFANRRIKAVDKSYRKDGKEILPGELVGPYTHRSKWHTDKTPLSRSVKFESQKAYRDHMRFLQSFERHRPNMTTYKKVQTEKLAQAVETSLGVEPPESLLNKINQMSPAQMSEFWNKFSNNAARLGLQYSSLAAMEQTLADMYPEDMEGLVQSSL